MGNIAVVRKGVFNVTKNRLIPKRFEAPDPEFFNESLKDYASHGEFISHKMRDGHTMYAKLFKKEGATKTIIFHHGFRGSPELNYYHAYAYLKDENINMVFIYARAHGFSEGQIITMGYKEKDDLHEWYELLQNMLNTDIYLWGVSMGCATTLLSLEKPYGDKLKGIIADCGYYNLYYEYYTCFKVFVGSFISRIFTEFLGLFISLVAHINFRKLKTTKVINNVNIPILFVHGSGDTFVFPQNTYKNYNAYNGPKDLLIVKDAPHALNMYYGKDEYLNKAKKLIGLI